MRFCTVSASPLLNQLAVSFGDVVIAKERNQVAVDGLLLVLVCHWFDALLNILSQLFGAGFRHHAKPLVTSGLPNSPLNLALSYDSPATRLPNEKSLLSVHPMRAGVRLLCSKWGMVG